MLAEKIDGYAEAKKHLDEASERVEAKQTEVLELDSKITDTTERLTAIQAQLEAAPLQMAKNELSTDDFVKLRYDCDALQAMLKGLEEVRTAQKAAYQSLSEERNSLKHRLDKMIDDYAEKMTAKFIDDAFESAGDALKLFISSVIIEQNHPSIDDGIFHQIGVKLSRRVLETHNPLTLTRASAVLDAKKHIKNVKESFLTEA